MTNSDVNLRKLTCSIILLTPLNWHIIWTFSTFLLWLKNHKILKACLLPSDISMEPTLPSPLKGANLYPRYRKVGVKMKANPSSSILCLTKTRQWQTSSVCLFNNTPSLQVFGHFLLFIYILIPWQRIKFCILCDANINSVWFPLCPRRKV